MIILLGLLIIVFFINVILIGILWGLISDYEELIEVEKKRDK